MKRIKSTYEGWTKTGRGQWEHESGIKVIRNHNKFAWQICGGASCGEMYVALWIAMHKACKTAAQWA